MQHNNEISSTDNLLTVIRGEGHNAAGLDVPGKAPAQTGRAAGGFGLNRKNVTIGVDISAGAVKLARLKRGAKGVFELHDYCRIPLPPGVDADSDAFPGFLRETLNQFCADQTSFEIWTALSSTLIETRYLKLPRVARKQLDRAVFWTFKRDVPFDEKVMQFGYDVLGDLTDGGVRKCEVMAYAVPRNEIEKRKALFDRIDFPLDGITIAPFAFQGVLRAGCLDHGAGSLCTLYIGREYSRIDIFERDHLVLSRVIKAGACSMLEALKEELTELNRGQPFEMEIATVLDNLMNTDEQNADFVDQLALWLTMPQERVFELVLPAVERLVRQVERTLEHYALHYNGLPVAQMFTFGEFNSQQRIAAHISEQLGLPCRILNLFDSARLRTDAVAPPAAVQGSQYVQSLALGLSGDDVTPNFLFTQTDKAHLRRLKTVNRCIAFLFAVLVAVIAGAAVFQGKKIATHRESIARLEHQLSQQKPPLDRTRVNQLAADISMQARQAKWVAGKYLPMAIISEITALTQPRIRLKNLAADLSSRQGTGTEDKSWENVTIEGVVTGEKMGLDVALASYLVNLKSSPLFGHAVVKQRHISRSEGEAVLNFKINLGLER